VTVQDAVLQAFRIGPRTEGAMNCLKGLLMLAVLTASVAGQVEHAPTVEQCQADQRLWLAEIEVRDPKAHPLF
jgi:hypothetical protein